MAMLLWLTAIAGALASNSTRGISARNVPVQLQDIRGVARIVATPTAATMGKLMAISERLSLEILGTVVSALAPQDLLVMRAINALTPSPTPTPTASAPSRHT